MKAFFDDRDIDTEATKDTSLLQEVVTTMKHARIFITSREKMHPTGVELYDALLAKLTRLM